MMPQSFHTLETSPLHDIHKNLAPEDLEDVVAEEAEGVGDFLLTTPTARNQTTTADNSITKATWK